VANIPNKLTIPLALLCAFVFLFSTACTRMVRPQGVSVDAVFVSGGKSGGWWQECTPSKAGQAVRCRIWNGAGLSLEDEGFLPYDGGIAPAAEELKIARDSAFSGPDRIFLTNGRILLPRSRFDELKVFVDWLEGKRGTPR
jgi:hypothetical protein